MKKILREFFRWLKSRSYDDLRFRNENDQEFKNAIIGAFKDVRFTHPEYFSKDFRNVKTNFTGYFLMSYSKRFLGLYISEMKKKRNGKAN